MLRAPRFESDLNKRHEGRKNKDPKNNVLQYLGISLRLFIFVFGFWIRNCSDELHFLMI